MVNIMSLNASPAQRQPLLTASSVTYSYPGSRSPHPVLEDFSLSVKEGEFFCLLGPSGCGKTSILNLLAGFTTPDGGTIELSGTRVCRADADRGVVFQTRSEEHTSELQSLMRISYAVFCLKKKKNKKFYRNI